MWISPATIRCGVCHQVAEDNNVEKNNTVSRCTLDAPASLAFGLTCGFALGFIGAWICWIKGLPELERRVELRTSAEASVATSSVRPASEEHSTEARPDDLRHIEGIGPRISGVLEEGGVATFRQLADADPDALRRMLRDEGLYFADPSTWPEQAALAATGAWPALEALQQELSAGRRVREG